MRILLTGQMRSGTTLLANVLNAQPGIVCLADFLHIARLKEEVGIASLQTPLNAAQKQQVIARFSGAVGGDGCRVITDATGASLDVGINADAFDSLLDFYHRVLDRLWSPGIEVVGHKTTCAEDILEELLECDPQVKCLYMVRDPRDVLLSNGRMMRQPPQVVLDNWRTGLLEARRVAGRPKHSGRLLIVRYEDFIESPEHSLRRIAGFLQRKTWGVPQTVDWYGVPYVSNSSFQDVTRLFDRTAIGRWQNADPDVSLLAERLIGREMVLAGYRTPLATRLRALLVTDEPRGLRRAAANLLAVPSLTELQERRAA